ncbi:MAG: cell division protein ZapA [Candidatus Marinimicrobia bacterium]|jgi:cell division protein ZapA (FtsZ GTPase activity inhibitor)|nr:cell division protein ZapA [Candidatus Neomarinimicrobiota bacterium]MDD4961373.1 cell division protein ZapA [Candidatus Neomarinimicrobiota bacterium]MDD5709719.1 cell division protein ZapA [Candidatus Neomarinimicrobiota bacterium]MDX9777706.1 cell division protein ZapA [bacterium]
MPKYEYDPQTVELEFPEDKPVKVTIYGQEFPLRGKDPAFIHRVADYVNEKMMEVGANMSGKLIIEKIAILAALNIAGELFQLKQDNQSVEEYIQSHSESLIGLIDEQLNT